MRNPLPLKLTGVLAFLLLGEASSLAGTNEFPVVLRWGENEGLSKWDHYSYPIDSRYTFWDRLPTLEQFPKLLALSLRKPTDQHILVSQLRTLSRCDFLSRDEVFEFQKGDYAVALDKWRAWWAYYGSQQLDRLKKEGRPHPDAWLAIAGSSGPPCPAYPLVLPPSWSFQLTFRSGDYGSVVEEVISMRVTTEAPSLRRRYHRSTNAPWEAEEWEGLTIEESRSFLASLIYAIDNPWLYVNDSIAEHPSGNAGLRHIKGRPKEWSNYYPGVEWTGILDPEGRVIINDDVWHWHTTDYRKHKTSLADNSCIGVVFRVIRDRFPDPTWNPHRSRWKATKLNAEPDGPVGTKR